MLKVSAIGLLFAATATVAVAHDFWIEPSTFHPAPGVNFAAGLRVGQEFLGDPVARDSSQIERFIVRDGSGEHNVAGLEKRDPAGYPKVETPGTAIIGYRSLPRPVELPPAKFEQYLRDEGLESIIAARVKSGDSAKPSKEIFSRCAKALVVAPGNGKGADISKPLDFRYEIIPVTNPYQMKGDEMRLIVRFEGKPLANALVVAMHQQDSSLRLKVRSDRKGHVVFHLPKAGVWLIKSVQMVPAPKSSDADWESLWASLTFER